MTPVLVHYRSTDFKPEGVWWFDGNSRMARFYTSPELQTVGEFEMSAVAGRADAVDVEDVFVRMSDRLPGPDVWVTAKISDEMTPPQYLKLLAKMTAKKVGL